MTKKIKSISSYRSDIAAFEKDIAKSNYLFHMKEFNPEGQLLKEVQYRPNGQTEWETVYAYEKLNLTGKQTFYIQEESSEKMVHAYDDKGRKIKDEYYFGDDIFETILYEYDAKDHLISTVRLDDEGNETEKETSEFDAEGRIIKQKFANNGGTEREIELEYNEAGQCIKERHKNFERSATEIIEYEYNEAGKKTSSLTKDEDGNLVSYVDVEYDEKMNPVKYISETSGFYVSKAINQITYDEQGRTIENEYYDAHNNYLMSKEIFVYDEEGNIKEQEIFEINPQEGMRKNHYRLQLQYDFLAGEKDS